MLSPHFLERCEELNPQSFPKTYATTILHLITHKNQLIFFLIFLRLHSTSFTFSFYYLLLRHPYDLPSNCIFTPDDLVQALSTLRSTSSNGTDGISTCLLFNCHNSLYYPIILIYRGFFDDDLFPSAWKLCSVTPILKSGDPTLVANYRPIIYFYINLYFSLNY